MTGGFSAGVLGLFRATALGLMAVLLQGVLKGATIPALAATLGLCLACVPLGVRVLQGEVQ